MSLDGKKALICGASQGIGKAIAMAFAEMGCRVIALARDGEKLASLVGDLPGVGHVALAHDLADRDGLASRVGEQLAAGGNIHILVNNCGGPKPGPIIEADETDFLQGFQNHVLSASLLVRLLLPGMRADGFGRILNVISTSVKIPIANLGVSNTIRGAMANWAKTLSLEVAPLGITVNNILPGFTATPRLQSLIVGAAERTGKSREQVRAEWEAGVPAKRFAKPEEVAWAAAFLASPAAAYINGINLPVDGGRTGSL